jgi:hypothetical protein
MHYDGHSPVPAKLDQIFIGSLTSALDTRVGRYRILNNPPIAL